MTVGDLLNMPGWQVMAIEEHEDRYVICARPVSCDPVCPQCGSSAAAKHGKDHQCLRDLPCHAKHVFIEFSRQRFRCLICKKTWFEPLSGVDERRFATLRLVRYIQQQSLTRTFAAIALECGLDEKSIRNLFHDYVEELERSVQIATPVIMGMDELHLLGQMRGVITDVQGRSFVEVLPDRKKQTIITYLAALPNKEGIQVCVIDMWRPYLEAIQETLPHVTVVIDKFHVIKQLNEIVEKVRKDVRSGLSERQVRQLMHDRFLLLKRPRSLSERDQLILEGWLGTFPRLKAVYCLKEEFYDIYAAHTEEEAFDRFFAWQDRVMASCVYDDYLDFLLTIERWGDQIFAYFRHRYTGGFVEAANGIGRVIDRQGRGYSFEVLRARMLYGQRMRQRKERTRKRAIPDDRQALVSVDEHLTDVALSTLTLPLQGSQERTKNTTSSG